ncbi:uncharacterized protein PHACADRAFT_258791 [Phanerochaete carnosa HHB-10118-sp]|uniref:Uncharacterized protein n=1 Tax=Phanerochaete carnosa (strain HHB-10118-sp) TaxID=650164 RepID=K5VTA2_PHACS|nr:uncharacterized protein PHACADRAFT_258791 [Phanerochaete carnosa HHB-10118-sp]EKM54748.1 hypothetical protein PHACADRAFT_258791 [Phanerochaete carnosa HHB-10118-sp]
MSQSLPSYDDVQREHDLRASFAHLTRDHEEIQKLFKSVAGQLESTPQIGEEHDLAQEWDALMKRHRKLYRDSQLNASQCASFLNNYATILIPLSEGVMTPDDKKFMINKFTEAVPVHQETARRISAQFHDLAKQVEVFPTKVSSFLRQEADKGNWLHFLWTGVEELCMTIWNGLQALLKAIINVFYNMLSRVGAIRFTCGPFVHVDVVLNESRNQTQESSISKQTIADAKADCKEIGNKLTGFEDAWHMVRLACRNLLDNVELAAGMTGTRGDVVDAYLKPAEIVYYPLVHCLRSYAAGKSPVE